MAELTTGSAVIARFGDSSWTVATVSAFVAAAEAGVARYCGRSDIPGGAHWLTHTRTEYRNGEYADIQPLRFTPVTAVSAVSIIFASGSTQSLTLTDLTMDGIEIADLTSSVAGVNGVLYMRSNPYQLWNVDSLSPYSRRYTPNFGGGKKKVKIAYTGGYATAAAIPDVVLAVQMITANMYRNKFHDPNVKSTTLGQFSETYGGPGNGQAFDVAQYLGDSISLLQDHKRIGV